MTRIFFALALGLLTHHAHAHKPSDSYLSLEIADHAIHGRWDIALRDLDYAIGLDADDDGELTWGEVRVRHDEIAAYALARLQVSADNRRCEKRVHQHLVDYHSDGAYAVLKFGISCGPSSNELDLAYQLFFDLDPQHRGLLRLLADGNTRSAIFSPAQAAQSFKLAETTRVRQFFDYGREGVWHIWIGFDHILFLIALMLPAVVRRERQRWVAIERFGAAFVDVVKVVTAFTIAHSITLSFAALEVVALPSRLVESSIAGSVLLAALNNVYPVFTARRWLVAFIFGLIHGFGFASVLMDLGLPRDALVVSLVGFNLGVEVGQLAIVALFLPMAWALRDTNVYRRYILIGGSCAIALLALIWFVERALDTSLMLT